MAMQSSKAISNTSRSLELSALVTSISSLLRALNPRGPNPKNLTSDPLNRYLPHLHPNLVVEVINKQTNPYYALFFFNWASNPTLNPRNYAHNNDCYEAITNLLLSHSLFSAAIQLLEQSGKLTDFFVSKLIKAYGDRGIVKASIFWFHRVRALENGKCLFSLNAIFGVFVRTNRMKLAECFFDQIVKGGVVQPDASTYSTMIKGFSRHGMIESARKVFDEMACKPNLVAFNIMINGYCKKGDMENATLLFNQMMESLDCLPNTVTHTTLIDGYCKKGEFEEAMKCMNKMENAGCQPNLLTYNAIIYGLCRRGHVDEAKKMMSKMRLNGLKENLATHTSILKGLSVVGKSQEAIEYFRWMASSKLNPGEAAYAVVVNELCKTRKPDEAISLLKEMRARCINPSVSSYNVVFRTLGELGELDKAISLLKQMQQLGCTPNFMSYNSVMHSLCRAKGRMQDVECLFSDMVRYGIPADATMYRRIIEGYCEDGNEEKAVQVFNEMVDKKFPINLDSFSVPAKELCAKKMAACEG